MKIPFQGSRISSDGGLIVVRELDARQALGEILEQHLTGLRSGKNTQSPWGDLLRQSAHSRLPGYEDVNDADELPSVPRQCGWSRPAAG